MKNIVTIFLLFIGLVSYSYGADRFAVIDDISKLLNENKIEEAIELIMKSYKDTTKTEAYRTIGTYYRIGEGVNKDIEKALYYYSKACDMGDHHSCRDKGTIFFNQRKYSDAEKIYIDLAKNKNDFASMGKLVDLYRVKSWSGASEEKAQYWLHQIK